MELDLLPFNKDYAVDREGNVYHIKNGHATKLKQDISTGYPRVSIGGKKYSVSRLIATVYCPKFFPATDYVKHLNGDRTDNRAENLEWTTMSDLKRE